MTFVAWDARVTRLALSTGRAFVTFDARISLEEARRASVSKGLEGTPRPDVPQAAGGTPAPCPQSGRGDSSVLQARDATLAQTGLGPRRTKLHPDVTQRSAGDETPT